MISIDVLVDEKLLDRQDKPKKIPVAAADFPAVWYSTIVLLLLFVVSR